MPKSLDERTNGHRKEQDEGLKRGLVSVEMLIVEKGDEGAE